MDTIKCGRKIFELQNGDTIMDNGACLQLITRLKRSGWHNVPYKVSKAAFKQFKNNPYVKSQNAITSGGIPVTYYIYNKETD